MPLISTDGNSVNSALDKIELKIDLNIQQH